MSNTQEQQDIIKYLQENDGLVLVDSIAGAGKTYLLTQIVKQLKPDKAIYLAYSKAIATEAANKFPSNVDCRTIHSIAYSNTVRPLGLKLGIFNYKTIAEPLPYDIKLDIIENFKKFCLSKYTSIEDYVEDNELSDTISNHLKKYLHAMADKEIECTHDFYLKLFHLMLYNNDITIDPVDLLMIDESGDLNEVTLEIFKLYPAKKKVAVGDKHQNIFSFNHTINAFDLLKDKGKEFKLTQSFRVRKEIAERVEKFCKTHLSKDMSFSGIEYEDLSVKTRGFITRTNAAIIDKIITLHKDGIDYTLIRKASDIFKLPLMLCSLTYQGTILNKEYKFIQNDVDDWYEDPELQKKYKTPLLYIFKLYQEDVVLSNAIKLVMKKSCKVIRETYKKAKEHENKSSNYYVATAHSSKGLEFDEAIISPDLNKAVAEIISKYPDKDYPQEAIDELNLYYVAATRGKKVLTNAVHL